MGRDNRGMSRPPPPSASITKLLRALVDTPSRAGEDALGPVLERVEAWFDERRLPHRRLRATDGRPLGLHAEFAGSAPPPRGAKRPFYVLNATLDTAAFGDRATWRHRPDRARAVGGWLYGRGAADSKAGAAIFAHLFAAFAARPETCAGRLGLLLDLEEHSGSFAGARRYFEARPAPRPDGVLIGYPGLERLIVGSRGFLRARIVVPGVAAHSGGSTQRGVNAVLRAARLVDALHAQKLPAAAGRFDKPPQLTVTSVHGGQGYTQVPDRCELTVDLRLTPRFDDDAARRLLARLIERADRGQPAELACRIDWQPGWPAYRVDPRDPMLRAMREAAHQVLGEALPCAVAGPSNIGNYLAARGIPALCGFGVRARHLHAADECMELATIAPVYRTYETALERLLRG